MFHSISALIPMSACTPRSLQVEGSDPTQAWGPQSSPYFLLNFLSCSLPPFLRTWSPIMLGPCHTQTKNSTPSLFSTRNPIIGTVWYLSTLCKTWACDRRVTTLHVGHSWPTLWLVLPCFAASHLPCSQHRTTCPLCAAHWKVCSKPLSWPRSTALSQAHDPPCQPTFPRQECQSVLSSPSCYMLTTFQRSPVPALSL